jgi:hypothetical protein
VNEYYTLRVARNERKKEEAHMRLFWSVVFTGGLLLVGLDVWESRRETRSGKSTTEPIAMMEDGTPLPPPPPPR